MRFVFSESAAKDVRSLSLVARRSLQKKFIFWQSHIDPLHFAKPLVRHKEATHRFCSGVYRILVKVEGDEVRILRVRHRKDVYKR